MDGLRLPLLVALLCVLVPGFAAAGEAEADEFDEAVGDANAARVEIKEAGGDYCWVNEGGPCAARPTSIAMAPSRPDVLYLGTPNGLFKSIDAAESWRPIGPTDDQGKRLLVRDVAVHPWKADVVYAAAEGLRVSTDGGETWRLLIQGSYVWHVEIDPSKPKTLYAVNVSNAVLKSTDGGETWARKDNGLTNPGFRRFDLDQACPTFLYGITEWSKICFTSHDAGTTWAKAYGTVEGIALGTLERVDPEGHHLHIDVEYEGRCVTYCKMPERQHFRPKGRGLTNFSFEGIEIDDADPELMHAKVSMREPEIQLSLDGGETWQAADLTTNESTLAALRASRLTPGAIYMGTRNGYYYRSEDTGKTWHLVYSRERGAATADALALDEVKSAFPLRFGNLRKALSEIALHPFDSDIAYYIDREQGVYKTGDGGTTWTQANNGLVAFAVCALACDPNTINRVYVVGKRGIYVSTDGAASWKQTREARFGPAVMTVHPRDPNLVLLAAPNDSVLASHDAGRTWRRTIVSSAKFDTGITFVFDPHDPNIFYLLRRKGGVFETRDHGQSWSRRQEARFPWANDLGTDTQADAPQVFADVIYATPDTKAIVRSTDVGITWEKTAPLPIEGSIRYFQVHPSDPRILAVVGGEGRLAVSRDAGDTWQAILFPTFRYHWASCVAFHPTDPDVFYIGATFKGGGVLRTRDGGRTFERLSRGLPTHQIAQIEISLTDSAVYAGLEDGGVYRLTND